MALFRTCRWIGATGAPWPAAWCPNLNKQKQPLYVAVNCGARKLNITGSGGTWKTWESPAESFERDLAVPPALIPSSAKAEASAAALAGATNQRQRC